MVYLDKDSTREMKNDLGEFYERRAELGIEFTREPKEMHGIHIAGISDADGAHISVSGPV